MFNKSEIMRRAWAIVKKGSEWQKYRLRYAFRLLAVAFPDHRLFDYSRSIQHLG